MKDKSRVLTILSGVITILLGMFTCVASAFVLIGVISGADPLFTLATLGMILIFQIILFIFALAIGITIIVIGAVEIKLGTLTDYEYSLRKGSVIGFSIFDGIVIAIAIIGMFIAAESNGFMILFGSLAGILLLSLLFKVIDFSLFKKKVNRGLISVERPKADFSNIDLSGLGVKKDQAKELEKLQNLKEKNLITEEEYQKLRQKVLDDMTK